MSSGIDGTGGCIHCDAGAPGRSMEPAANGARPGPSPGVGPTAVAGATASVAYDTGPPIAAAGCGIIGAAVDIGIGTGVGVSVSVGPPATDPAVVLIGTVSAAPEPENSVGRPSTPATRLLPLM